MTEPLLISIVGGTLFAVAAIVAYIRLHFGSSRITFLVPWAAAFAVLFDMSYFAMAFRDHGPIDLFRHGSDAALLLSALVGLVGLGIYLSPTLRGLDGFLFLFAAVVQFGAIALRDEPIGSPSYQPWFVSHGLAFAVSGACFVAAGAAGLAYRLVYHVLRRKQGTHLVGVVPPLESLERFGRWMLAIGFPIYTYGVLTGICGLAHRDDLRQSAWYLDVSVVLSAVVWLVYAYGLGALIFRPQLRGPKAATLSACAMVLAIAALLTRQFISPVHQ